jgi:hypothetical protein
MKLKLATAAVLVTALALPNAGTSAAAVSSNAAASATAKCRKAKRKVAWAKEGLRRARKSGKRAKIKRAKRRLRKADKAKKKACLSGKGTAPPTSGPNHSPYFQDPFNSITYTSIDLIHDSEGFLAEAEVHLTVVDAVDSDGDPLTYLWTVDSSDSWGPGTIQPSAKDPRSATWHVPARAGVLACGSASVRVSDGTGRGPNDTAYFGLIAKSKYSATISSYLEGLCGTHIS